MKPLDFYDAVRKTVFMAKRSRDPLDKNYYVKYFGKWMIVKKGDMDTVY